MADNLYQRVDSIKAKARLLVERYRALKQSKAEADVKIEELTAVIRSLERQIADRDREIEQIGRAHV